MVVVGLLFVVVSNEHRKKMVEEVRGWDVVRGGKDVKKLGGVIEVKSEGGNEG